MIANKYKFLLLQRTDKRGSFSLEILLLIVGALFIAIFSLPSFFNMIGGYFEGFSETTNQIN